MIYNLDIKYIKMLPFNRRQITEKMSMIHARKSFPVSKFLKIGEEAEKKQQEAPAPKDPEKQQSLNTPEVGRNDTEEENTELRGIIRRLEYEARETHRRYFPTAPTTTSGFNSDYEAEEGPEEGPEEEYESPERKETKAYLGLSKEEQEEEEIKEMLDKMFSSAEMPPTPPSPSPATQLSAFGNRGKFEVSSPTAFKQVNSDRSRVMKWKIAKSRQRARRENWQSEIKESNVVRMPSSFPPMEQSNMW